MAKVEIQLEFDKEEFEKTVAHATKAIDEFVEAWKKLPWTVRMFVKFLNFVEWARGIFDEFWENLDQSIRRKK